MATIVNNQQHDYGWGVLLAIGAVMILLIVAIYYRKTIFVERDAVNSTPVPTESIMPSGTPTSSVSPSPMVGTSPKPTSMPSGTTSSPIKY